MMKSLCFCAILCGVVLLSLSACRNRYDGIAPAIVPDTAPKVEKKEPKKNMNMKIIGAIEPIYILPMKTPFYARIDTGAETSSIDVSNLRFFERDGEKWASFDVVNRTNGETHNFEKKIKKRVAIRRVEEYERRRVVEMTVKFGDETFKANFSLADRKDFDYQALVGRNIIGGRAIVDITTSNTLH